MRSEIFDIIVPSIFFFIAFFLAYSLVEAFIILLLNRIMFRTWGFTLEKLKTNHERYGGKIRFVTLFLIGVVIAAMLKLTNLLEILQAATLEIKVLAIETLLAMVLIYLTTTRKLTQFEMEKSIHKYLYIYLSIVVFTFTMLMADTSYARYKDFINANVTAVVKGAERKLESSYKNDLVADFRKKIYQGECPEINFLTAPAGTGVKNFVYVVTNSDLVRATMAYDADTDTAKDLRGRLCTNNVETFLLTDHGRWYWVIES